MVECDWVLRHSFADISPVFVEFINVSGSSCLGFMEEHHCIGVHLALR